MKFIKIYVSTLKVSYVIDFEIVDVDEKWQILALIRAVTGFFNFSEAPLIFSWNKTSSLR